MFFPSSMKALFVLVAAAAFFSCARQFHYSSGEAGRVARYFQVDENEVSRIYSSSGFSWDETIRQLLEAKTLSGGEAPEDFSARFEEEAEKIRKECAVE
ncbi:MAG: hypothetical protein ABII20_00865 [Candidatus Omnitrophota bacterium]|nr:hypothetical protein [Candidatus Omnitrophota bacterium]MBU3929731.1 hypothetical protein [bacterium]MBU4123566.1 hypothetical protein [bacterium]